MLDFLKRFFGNEEPFIEDEEEFEEDVSEEEARIVFGGFPPYSIHLVSGAPASYGLVFDPIDFIDFPKSYDPGGFYRNLILNQFKDIRRF